MQVRCIEGLANPSQSIFLFDVSDRASNVGRADVRGSGKTSGNSR